MTLPNSQPVFAVGTGRCGTKTLAHLFGQLPRVESLHEPEPRLLRLAIMKFEHEPYDFQRALSHSRSFVNQHKFYFESSMYNSWLIDELVKLWPQAKFVWLVRDAAGFAQSAYRRGWYHPESDTHMKMFQRLRPVPPDGWPKDADRWYKLGYFWKSVNDTIQAQLTQHVDPDHTCRVRTEDLDNLEAINRLADWCGFPGQVTTKCHANNTNQRLTIAELNQLGYGADLQRLGVKAHPFAWKPFSQWQRLGLDIDVWRDAFPVTDVVRDTVLQGTSHPCPN